VLLNPLKGLKGLGDLVRSNKPLEDMVLKEGIGRVILLLSLKDDARMLKTANLSDMSLFLRFTANIVL
jgi:hypothetical protein